MMRLFGPGMPSDAIAHRIGFDGNESKETLNRFRAFQHLGLRSTFCLNTFYEEVLGGYYENRALFLLLDRAVRLMGLSPIILECYRSSGLIPVEGDGQFLIGEEYSLVLREQSQAGLLSVWQFSTGGGGAYYGDNIIFDFILSREITFGLADEVERQCGRSGIRFVRESSLPLIPC